MTVTAGLIRVEDRQSNTMNHTLNGFYSNPEPKAVQKDGTVVLQATLTMGNRQYLLNSLDSNSKQLNTTVVKDPKLKKSLNTHSLSPPKTSIV